MSTVHNGSDFAGAAEWDTDRLLTEAQVLLEHAASRYRVDTHSAQLTEISFPELEAAIARAGTRLICAFPAIDGHIQIRERIYRAIRTAGRRETDIKILSFGSGDGRALGQDFPAEVRTITGIIPEFIAIDDLSVVIRAPAGGLGAHFLKVENRLCTTTLTTLFKTIWEFAEVADECPPGDCRLCHTSTMVVDALARGATDESAAQHIGMSVRTYRRHVARIMDELRVRSRFQAGLKIARHGMKCEHCHRERA